jgi:methionyl-tRNA synthetase
LIDSPNTNGDQKAGTESAEAKPVPDESGLIDISEFARIKMRVAEVLEAEPVEGTDRLLKLQIDVGFEKRQIVAGIAEFYSPDTLLGKKIIVVVNLRPAIIRGVKSNGMLLAAKSGDRLCLVSPDNDLPPGAKIS